MSAYLNKASLIGNLGRDPEVRTTQSGKQVVTLSIATSESWRDSHSGERVERTEWHRVVIWNEKLGAIVEDYAVKGAKVYVEGKLVTNKWTDNAGIDRYSTEIHLTAFDGVFKLLDSKKRDGERGADRTGERASDEKGASTRREPALAGASAGGDLDDEIPF